jgi:hypothetical protein
LADEITIGLIPRGVSTAGACPKTLHDEAAASPAAAVVKTNSRRFIFLLMIMPPKKPIQIARHGDVRVHLQILTELLHQSMYSEGVLSISFKIEAGSM